VRVFRINYLGSDFLLDSDKSERIASTGYHKDAILPEEAKANRQREKRRVARKAH
jgi:hypothetical protein